MGCGSIINVRTNEMINQGDQMEYGIALEKEKKNIYLLLQRRLDVRALDRLHFRKILSPFANNSRVRTKSLY